MDGREGPENPDPQEEPKEEDNTPTPNSSDEMMCMGDKTLRERLNILELSLAAAKREAETWRYSMTHTMNGLTQTQEKMTTSLNRVTSMVQTQDERQQKIEMTHQTITSLLPWMCQQMGHPSFKGVVTQTPSGVQMTPVAEKRGLVTPPRIRAERRSARPTRSYN